MRLGLMAGDVGRLVQAEELETLGFSAVQMFFGGGSQGDSGDPTPEQVDVQLQAGNVALAAMALHVDLIGPDGQVEADVDRAVRCVQQTAALDGRFGDNARPVMIWHPSGYLDVPGVDDHAVYQGLCEALSVVCAAAETSGVYVAVEITRAGSIGSAETYLRVKDSVGSDALRVCMDAANFVPDRTPLERAVRMLGPDIVIAHGKDARFDETGHVAAYGPTGSGKLDYPSYINYLNEYAGAPYFVLEYCRSRADLLTARDIALKSLR